MTTILAQNPSKHQHGKGHYTYKKSFLELYPHLENEIHPTKNNFRYSHLTPGSHKKLWWKCNKGHEWECEIQYRTLKNSGCRACANESLKGSRISTKEHARRLKIKRNRRLAKSFKVSAPPHLFAEANNPLNKSVDFLQLHVGSSQKIWWVCSTCNHAWKAQVGQRTRINTRCPQCVRKDLVGTSKLEYRFFDVLSNHPDISDLKHGVTLEQKFESGRKMTVDFAFTHIPTGTYVYMEIDGKRWHKDEAQFKLDEYKTNKLLEETDAYIVRTRNDGLDFLDINHERLRQVNFKWSTNEGPIEAMVKDILEGICS